jgi:hypothetical protein
MYTKWMFHTGDCPEIYACPGAVPIEMAHFFTTVLIDVELALRARGRLLTTTRADRELAFRINLGVLNVPDGNFSIFVICTGIVVKVCLLAP